MLLVRVAKGRFILARRSQEKRVRGEEEGTTMGLRGVISSKDVLQHSGAILREFGAGAYLRCCLAILLRRRTTFLACVCRIAH
jgi:hypothetical protein